MANSDTIKAITANLTAILDGLGFKIEDLSADPSMSSSPVCVVLYSGEDFGAGHGERPLYNEIRYSLEVRFSDKHPATSRDKIADWAHKIRENVHVSALNTGALAVSKLVSWVNHDGYDVEYSPPVTQIECRLKIRYREILT